MFRFSTTLALMALAMFASGGCATQSESSDAGHDHDHEHAHADGHGHWHAHDDGMMLHSPDTQSGEAVFQDPGRRPPPGWPPPPPGQRPPPPPRQGQDQGQQNQGQNNAVNQVEIKVDGNYRVITANGIPDHQTGQFPNNGNPNRISAQRYTWRMPANPKKAEKVAGLNRMLFGVALNGVPFDPGTAEFWNNDRNWNYDALSGKINLGLDHNHAHVQPGGAYHYHGIPTGLIQKRGGDGKMVQVGWAADGFPIYSQYGHTDPKDANSALKKMTSSWALKPGDRNGGPGGKHDGTFTADWAYKPGSGDLDECNGRFGVTPEYPDGIYHYYLTESYPFIPRFFRGTPDSSFRHTGPPPGQGGPGGRGPGGPGGPGGGR